MLGKNRTDLNSSGTNYRHGNPVTLPHTFGNVVTTIPANNDNQIPTSGTEKNAVTLPHTFGNNINLASGN